MTLNLDYKPVELVSTAGMAEEDWLDWRRKGIGGSDSAAVMGCSPFCTTRDLFYDKRGIAPAMQEDSNWVTLKVGHLLEPLVAEIFARKTGYRVYQIQMMYRHPLYPFMQADVDYFIETDDGRHGILECKTSHPNNKGKWENDAIPYNYELQCRHYMAVMNLDFVWIACLFSNSESDFVMRYIERDLDLEEELIRNEQHFWEDYVQAGIEPRYTEDGDLVLASLRKHYGPSDPEEPAVVLAPALAADLHRYLQLKARKQEFDQKSREADRRMKEAIAPVLDVMGTAERAVLDKDGVIYTVSYASRYRHHISKESLEKLKLDHPEVYDAYATVSESRTCSVKVKEETK